MLLNGKIIAIEGTDGSGKQTQTLKLKERLEREGYDVYSTSFPNYSSDSSAPVKMYLNGQIGTLPEDVSAKAASTFFAVDRYITYKKEIEPVYTQKNKVIVFDRYVSSNIIHQGAKLTDHDNVDDRELEELIFWINTLEHTDLGLPKPDITIYLNVPLSYTEKLRENRANKITGGAKQDIHEANEEYLKRCNDVGLKAAKLLGWNIIDCVEDGVMRSIEDIADQIWQTIFK